MNTVEAIEKLHSLRPVHYSHTSPIIMLGCRKTPRDGDIVTHTENNVTCQQCKEYLINRRIT